MSRIGDAFVIIVDDPHATVDGRWLGLFYRVVRVDSEGRLVSVLEPEDYPWHWGFERMEHALKVARNYNDADEDSIGSSTLARQLADVERNEGVPHAGDDDILLSQIGQLLYEVTKRSPRFDDDVKVIRAGHWALGESGWYEGIDCRIPHGLEAEYRRKGRKLIAAEIRRLASFSNKGA